MANIDNVQLPDGSSYNIVDNTSGFATQNYVDSAVSSVTKTTIGLGNVDNTSDLNKPISTATQTALDTLDEDKADKTDIATVESGTTASRAYSVGELVYVSGTLYRVKTAIASGATFTVGTNIEVTNVSNELKSAIYMDLPIDISSYTQSNPYTAPSDGYAYLGVASGGNGLMWIKGADGSGGVAMGGQAGFWCCYVKKGMKIYATNSPSTARFASLY